LMNNPTSQELSQILVCVGLAQNFAALRALAI
jgi:hydroxymethylglutaryl-CoA reductase